MASPIKPSDICGTIINAGDLLCDKFKSFINLAKKLCTFWAWWMNADGSFSTAFKLELAQVSALIGAPVPWLTSSIPNGYVILNGSAYNRTEYVELFAVYGTLHGPGDGSTTFNVPDMSGRVFMGADGSHPMGSTGGEDQHTLTVDELAAHTHGMKFSSLLSGNNNPPNQPVSDADIATPPASQTTVPSESAGGGLPHNNLQPYFAGYWITRAKTI